MKKIILGRSYDTETAKLVGGSEQGMAGDLDWTCETLYRKKTGEYFIHGEGGTRTVYAHQLPDGGWRGGEAITPMAYGLARDWAQRNLPAEEYEREFGTASEGDTVLSTPISAAAKRKLEQAAQKEGVTQRHMLEMLIAKMQI